MFRNKLMTACSVAVLTAALYGCSSSSDDGANLQVQDLQDQIAALEAALGEDQELTPEAITALKSEIASLEMDIDNDDPADPGLDQQITALEDERDGLEMQINNDDAANPGLNQQITALDTMITTLTGERDGLEMQINNEDPANPGLNQQLMSLTGERDGLKMQINNDDPDNPGLDQRLATLTGERDGLEMQINNDDAANPGLNQQITALDTMITTLTGERDGLEMQINNEDPDNPGLDQRLATLTGERDGLEMQINNDDAANPGLNQQITALEAQINNEDADNPGLNQQITALKAQINSVDPDNPGLDAQITKLENEKESLQNQVDAFATARNAQTDAEGFATAADKAVMDATAASMKITARAEGVAGNSATAEENAQAVLGAQTAANKAVDDADAAVRSAKDALAEAEGLPSDNPNRDTLIAALKDAIKAAEGHAEDAADFRGDDNAALAMAVKVIKGDDPEAEGYPMTPAQHGRAVAMDVAMALVPASETDGARMRGEHSVTAPVADQFPDAVTENDHQGSTWAEIVGAANVVEKRIGRTGGGTEVVSAASFAGMTLGSITVGPPAAGAEITDGMQYNDANYKGIPGRVFCAGSDCMVEGDADSETLTGSWYFTPTNGDEWYVQLMADADYTVENMYVRFGHWLDLDADGPNTEVKTFAMTGGNMTGVDVNTVNTGDDATALTDTSASYRGPAAGMSVEKTTNTDGVITEINSAAFTAMVNLKATFGDGDLATLGGTVTDFQGAATDPKWSVGLQSKTFTGTFDDGRTVATGRDGVWSATAYGPQGGRPTGVFGGFNAHFTDGHAAGAYTTR